ncbi:Hypothetical lipoprotein precursor [Flavobacterium indicum GPTSA100-9 = DSM 17447]|uniref:Hypothetical lipoprotein n=1 Tax=Flavobacterium indicum (strain DSM 17447 / CIP 109464 / GPTSA100-9) TaxID=1094466 RepID=H8XNH7_FLAIG|nr:hypothetical protein [Flavobacterium indicum]CCG52094.1 Hypothetical lipoprotein precursor [Flavobacterium indicum GPTSA100-9 = DSM 17447]
MNKIFLIIIASLSLVSCKSSKINETTYILPFNVEKTCYEYLKSHNFDGNYFFVLENYSNDISILKVIKIKDISNQYFGFKKINQCNYSVLINDKYYPLVFQTDLKYGIKFCDTDSFFDINYRENNEVCFKNPPTTIYEYSKIFYFNNNGYITDEHGKLIGNVPN